MKSGYRFLPVIFSILTASCALADDKGGVDPFVKPLTASVQRTLQDKYPATTFSKVEESKIPGVYEVTMGQNVVYTNAEGRYFIFGHLFDMQERKDLTAEKRGQLPPPAAASKIAFADLPFDHAIKSVKGTGARKIAVFADPNCTYCKSFEGELAKIDNLTVYTFMIPILSEDSRKKAAAIWCSPDRAKAWRKTLLEDKAPEKSPGCDATSVLDQNLALSSQLGIHGTPTYLLPDGSITPGAAPAATLIRLLGK